MVRSCESLSRRSALKKAGLLTTGFGVTGIAGCTGGDLGGSDELDLLIGTAFASGHPINQAFIDWADSVAEETDGDIDITIEEQLDGEIELMEQTNIGAIDGSVLGSAWLIEYAPNAQFAEIPWVYDNWEQQLAAFDSDPVNEAINVYREEGNQHIIGDPMYRGQRYTTSNQPVEDIDDLQGLSIRLPENDHWVHIWSNIGVSPTTVAFNEVYSALQTGVVDAQENPVADINALRLFEVQDYLNATEHLVPAAWFVFNHDEVWNTFTDENQEYLEDTIISAANNADNEMREAEMETVDTLTEDMELIETDTDPIVEAGREIADEMFEDGIYSGSLDEVLE